MIRALFVFVTFCIVSSLYGQEPYGIHYTTQDGLPSDMLYDIIQDRDGRIWFGTEKGAVEYNGSEFQVYTVSDGLLDDEVLELYESKSGRIWMSSYNQWPIYYKDGRFHQLEYPADKEPKNIHSMAYCERKNGDIVIGSLILHPNDSTEVIECSSNGLYKKGRQMSTYLAFEDLVLSGNDICDCREFLRCGSLDSENQWVLDFRLGVSLLRSGEFFRPAVKVEEHKWGYNNDHQNIKLLRQVHVLYPDVLIYTIKRKSANEFFLATSDGLLQVLHQGETITRVEKWLKGIKVGSLLIDDRSDLWVTTLGQGLYYYPNTDIQWVHSGNSELIGDNVSGVYADEYGVLTGNNDGVVQVFSHLKSQIQEKKKVDLNKMGDHIEHFKKVYRGSKKLYMLIVGEGFFTYDSQLQDVDFRPLLKNEVGNMGRNIKAVFESSHHELYYGTARGVFKQEADSLVFLEDKQGKINYTGVLGIEEKGDTLLLATKNGLKGMVDRKVVDFSQRFPELKNSISDIQKIGGVYWLVTANKGLIKWDGRSIDFVGEREGLSSNHVMHFISKNESEFWLVTSKGVDFLKLLDSGKWEVENYDQFNGLSTSQIRGAHLYEDKLYLATYNGLMILPEKARKKRENIRLLTPRVFQDSLEMKSPEQEKIENNLRLVCEAIDFQNGGNIQYHYRMKGVSDHWSVTDNKEIIFNSLPYGEFTFELWAEGIQGARSRLIQMPFYHEYPFWMRWWVVALEVLLGGWLIYFFTKRRIMKVASREQRMVELELNSLRSQMNPHFIFNALVSVDNSLRKKDLDNARGYLKRFAKLMRQVLNSSRNDFIDLAEEVEILNFYLELEQEKTEEFDFEIEVDESLDDDLLIPPMILQPFIENCLVHAFYRIDYKGMIHVRFSPEDTDFIQVTIEDNGVGRAKAKERSQKQFSNKTGSIGILASGERLQKLSARSNNEKMVKIIDLYDDQGRAIGTRVELLLPFQEWD